MCSSILGQSLSHLVNMQLTALFTFILSEETFLIQGLDLIYQLLRVSIETVMSPYDLQFSTREHLRNHMIGYM